VLDLGGILVRTLEAKRGGSGGLVDEVHPEDALHLGKERRERLEFEGREVVTPEPGSQ